VRLRWLLALVALVALATSCAYYNTFFLARKYYNKATAGQPYTVDKAPPTAAPDFNKAIDYSKKVLANYPKSKWVGPAYLLWARALLGRDDPRETVNMLQDFDTRFPKSPLRLEALFYLGVAYRQSHRYSEAEATLDLFLGQAPKNDLAPYAWLERSRALTSLDRDSAAAYCAGQVLERFPRSRLGPQALAARADALLQAGDYAHARADYQSLGRQANNDEQRLGFLFKEADCLEAAHDYGTELALLREALGHEQAPPTTGDVPIAPTAPGSDRYGRLLVRIGTAELLAGKLTEALDSYGQVAHFYPKTPLGAEAQYRIGYAYETAGDDFTRARGEYARVVEQSAASVFAQQAQSRVANLDRVMQYQTAGGDTLRKRAEEGLLLAELYLFQLGKPERALEEYGKVAAALPGTPWAAKARDAQAWVLSRKLGRQAQADSLFWMVIYQYPGTEGQIAARDYLEGAGVVVPDSLIKMPSEPEPQFAAADTAALTAPPGETPRLGGPAVTDSVRPGGLPSGPQHGFMRVLGPPHRMLDPRFAGTWSGAPSLAGDSPFNSVPAGSDSAAVPVPPRSHEVGTPPDSLERPPQLALPRTPLGPAPPGGRPPGGADSTHFER
jgi:tetratricopeptide (TPR) repeat protein